MPGTSAFRVRPARNLDAEGLARVAAATFPLACPPTTTERAKADFIEKNLTAARFSDYLADPSRRLLLAESDGAVIGYTMLILPAADGVAAPADPDVRSAVTTRPTAELSKVYVLPGHHGAGIAWFLVDETVAIAQAEGAASVWLGVNQLNARANRFYEKCGFARVGTKRFLVGDVWEDDFVRGRVLTAETSSDSRLSSR